MSPKQKNSEQKSRNDQKSESFENLVSEFSQFSARKVAFAIVFRLRLFTIFVMTYKLHL